MSLIEMRKIYILIQIFVHSCEVTVHATPRHKVQFLRRGRGTILLPPLEWVELALIWGEMNISYSPSGSARKLFAVPSYCRAHGRDGLMACRLGDP